MSGSSRDMDCTNAQRGLWLVKVPKYISSKWENVGQNNEIGRLKISKGAGKPEIMFSLSDELLNSKDSAKSIGIPKENRFIVSNITNQTLAVFSQGRAEDKSDLSSISDAGPIDPARLCLEGHIVQRAECRPPIDDKYMRLKRDFLVKASQPVRLAKQLDKVVTNYKPVSDHKHNIEYEQKKKTEGKKSREDKDKVMDMLFSAFEKHQYYNIKDLEKLTRQPIPYLKEILKEICNYNAKNPHKNMWELKPEYRHYKDQEQMA